MKKLLKTWRVKLLAFLTPEPEIKSEYVDKVVFLLRRDFKINPLANVNKGEKIYENVFKLNILDYKDFLTGNPKAYYVYIQKNEIEIIKPLNLFFQEVEKFTIFNIYKIEENTISPSKNIAAKFSFKPIAEIPSINVRFTLFTDWLSSIGSYFTLCSLAAKIIMGIFTDIIIDSNIMKSLKAMDNSFMFV